MAAASVEPLRVLISGAAGQIGYSLIPLFATGQVFGPDQPLCLHLLEIEPALNALKGVAMEIEDGAFPLVRGLILTHVAEEAFRDIDYAVLVGGFPRKKGMLRKDLLAKNKPIFQAMGEALESFAKTTTKVLVVANPANTNCLTASSFAPKIPKTNFAALTRLDMNRARAQLAAKMAVPVGAITNVTIWGNHSATQVPDVNNALVAISGAKVPVRGIVDDKWVRSEFRSTVQQRGKSIIEARGLSSAMSAANATKDCLRDWAKGTPEGQHVAMAVFSDGSYGIEKGIFYSFPCVCKGGEWGIVQGAYVADDVRELMKASEKELLDEKAEAGL